MTRALADVEGIFAGISCGAALAVALRVGRDLDRGNIVVLLADGGWKYLSTGLWTRPLEQVAEEIATKVNW
jgi:cysteine synthase B